MQKYSGNKEDVKLWYDADSRLYRIGSAENLAMLWLEGPTDEETDNDEDALVIFWNVDDEDKETKAQVVARMCHECGLPPEPSEEYWWEQEAFAHGISGGATSSPVSMAGETDGQSTQEPVKDETQGLDEEGGCRHWLPPRSTDAPLLSMRSLMTLASLLPAVWEEASGRPSLAALVHEAAVATGRGLGSLLVVPSVDHTGAMKTRMTEGVDGTQTLVPRIGMDMRLFQRLPNRPGAGQMQYGDLVDLTLVGTDALGFRLPPDLVLTFKLWLCGPRIPWQELMCDGSTARRTHRGLSGLGLEPFGGSMRGRLMSARFECLPTDLVG